MIRHISLPCIIINYGISQYLFQISSYDSVFKEYTISEKVRNILYMNIIISSVSAHALIHVSLFLWNCLHVTFLWSVLVEWDNALGWWEFRYGYLISGYGSTEWWKHWYVLYCIYNMYIMYIYNADPFSNCLPRDYSSAYLT